ncbi:Manganese transport protein MntH [Streptococcus sp. ZB199]|nr:Manganese transport protein MntH [Streptococcus sp. ZB199]
MSLQQFERKSLQEINQSIDVPKGIPFWKTLLLFSGPGSLVAVGYMDPGNWITSVVGGPNTATSSYLWFFSRL